MRVLVAPGSGSNLGQLGDGDPGARVSGHDSVGASRTLKQEAVVCRLGDWLSQRPAFWSRAEWWLAVLSSQ